MKLYHWLKCDWSKWSERKTREVGWYNPKTGTSSKTGVEHYQLKTCNTCNKIQEQIIY
jgi:hypothetical protein